GRANLEAGGVYQIAADAARTRSAETMKSRIHIFAAVLLLAVLALHGQAQSTLDAAGPAARSLSGVSWFVYILFIAVAVIMWALIWRMATPPPRPLHEHPPLAVPR